MNVRVVAGSTASNEVSSVSSASAQEVWDRSGEREYNALDDAKLQSIFIEAGNGKLEDADTFFSRFKYVDDLLNGNFSLALEGGIYVLSKCKQIDAAVYKKIHKGTPFYWLGMAAFLVRDYQNATFFFDSAVSEDIRAGRDPANNSSPSFHFIQIEGEQPAQAAKELVLGLQSRVEAEIADYNKRPGRPAGASDLELARIRERFLLPSLLKANERWRSLATTLISYFLEWDYRSMVLDLRAGSGTAEPFFSSV